MLPQIFSRLGLACGRCSVCPCSTISPCSPLWSGQSSRPKCPNPPCLQALPASAWTSFQSVLPHTRLKKFLSKKTAPICLLGSDLWFWAGCSFLGKKDSSPSGMKEEPLQEITEYLMPTSRKLVALGRLRAWMRPSSRKRSATKERFPARWDTKLW